jgi:integrase
LEFLLAEDVPWEAASVEDLKRFRDAHQLAISPQTADPYSEATIRARMQEVIGFYRFATKKAWYSGSLCEDLQSIVSNKSIDADSMAHIRKGEPTITKSELNYLLPTPRKAPPNPFTIPDWRRLIAVLGPMPSEQDERRTVSCRDRLMIEVAIWTGLRLSEVRGLTKYQFLSLVPDPDAPASYQALTVAKSTAKGKKERRIRIPNWLVGEINFYIEGERADCFKVRKTSRREPSSLFVSTYGRRWSGKAIGNRRIEQILEDAVVKAGLITVTPVEDAHTGKIVEKGRPKYSYHDLRHTYAVWTYWVERQRGNSEPWKHIQAQLGHRHLQTTIDTYLHYVEIFDGFERPVDVREILGL